MNNKLIDRAVAGIVFLVSLVLYLLTVSPTASFWDAGEFIAIAHGLQVSHPPGAPFYMLVGRLFSMFVPTEYVALSVNLISVLASALTVLLTHLIIVRLTRQWLGHPDEWTPPQRIIALVGGAVGALTFAVTDSFWFNAVEAEVYALSRPSRKRFRSPGGRTHSDWPPTATSSSSRTCSGSQSASTC